MQEKITAQQANAYAMNHGIGLGLWAIATLTLLRLSFIYPICNFLFALMFILSPFASFALTRRFKKQVCSYDEGFPFRAGFLHALFTGFYATVWAAVFIYAYFSYFDQGAFFTDYANAINTPEMNTYLQQSGMNAQLKEISGQTGVKGLVNALQSAGAAAFAAMPLYVSLFVGPVISLITGLILQQPSRK